MKPRSNAWHDGTGSDAPSRRNCGCLPTKYFGYTLRLMPIPTVDPADFRPTLLHQLIVGVVPEWDVGKTARARLKQPLACARLRPQERPSGRAFLASPNVILRVGALIPHRVRQPRKSVSTRALSCHAAGPPNAPGRRLCWAPRDIARGRTPVAVERRVQVGNTGAGPLDAALGGNNGRHF